ncbi:hypothetical protein HaLaN_15186, partial [Haematococcus lacustris]
MEEEDAEAELERELAALRSNSEVSITAYLETSPGLGQNLTTSDDVRTIILAADRAAELAREDQRASAQQEQERLHKQGAEVLMASDLARRRQAAAAAQQELDEQLAAQAWRGFAARHIQRAWRKYAASPAAMLRKHRVTLIQAAWRGRAARKAVGGMRQQQAVLLQLEAAVAKGDMGAVQQVAEQASNM